MSALVSGLVGAALAAFLVVLSAKTRKRVQPNTEGWKVLRPNWLIKGTILGSGGMSLFFGYIWLFIGSSRLDAETQMISALVIFAVFGFQTLFLIWLCFARTIMWKGNKIRIKWALGSTSTMSMNYIEAVKENRSFGFYRLVFTDRKSFLVSKEMHGIDQLLEKLPGH
ncbi:MAG: hypothetical protein AB8B54_13370 [Sphingorhabdus sp.]